MKNVAIGCGLAVVLFLGIASFGLYQFGQWAEGQLPDVEAFAERRAELVDAYGTEDAYVPPLAGDYDPTRVALYVDLREQLWPRQQVIGEEIDRMIERAVRGEDSGVRGFFTQMRAAFGTVGRLTHHAAYTDSLLLENAMGRGEYTHLQLVLTRGWMGLENGLERWRRVLEEAPPDDQGMLAIREIEQAAEDRSSELLRAHYRNLLDAAGTDVSDSVAAYIDRLERGDRTRPFTDPVPPRLQSAFDDHTVRLRMTTPRSLGAWLAETPALLQEDTLDDSRSQEVKVEF